MHDYAALAVIEALLRRIDIRRRYADFPNDDSTVRKPYPYFRR
jgi:hypothetical protein